MTDCPIILTCVACGHTREPQEFDTHFNLGGQTASWCDECREMVPHFIGLPAPKIVPREPKVKGKKKRS